jgi:DNA-binding transcriptional regulator YhcF (GntR family)
VAQQGRKIDEGTRRQILRLAGVLSVRGTARELAVDPKTVQKYRKNLPGGR